MLLLLMKLRFIERVDNFFFFVDMLIFGFFMFVGKKENKIVKRYLLNIFLIFLIYILIIF